MTKGTGGKAGAYPRATKRSARDAAAHPSTIRIQCDVTDKTSLQSVVDFVTKEMGHIGLVIANSSSTLDNVGIATYLSYNPESTYSKIPPSKSPHEPCTPTLPANCSPSLRSSST
ncbi:uncharacterized protein F4807DRAFT_270882 [Annulohypoxylon truncatum]|uniref:uncharacterized protein n=1 Tax=Annulohypoxylon truncatum TaxID=327061 RepID=UPI002007EC51|nr:uncharacterized protein F4807DRAFT_270882 [Annulohypoxylon truncatum]KAI1213583.1 hypothetical protein F4807DRAFT_270882 [Annulohypoxylon truncatum]